MFERLDAAGRPVGLNLCRGVHEDPGGRHSENALNVIERVKQKLKDIEPGFPPGVKVVSNKEGLLGGVRLWEKARK